MKSKYLHIKSFHSILLIMVALLMNVTLTFGQGNINSTKITDGSAEGSIPNAPAIDFSILELESATKGFLLPRMTTSERDKIVISDNQKERGNGLAIYNIDDDCINYWSKSGGGKDSSGKDIGKWLSVCGALPPAKIEYVDCKNILNASGLTELTQGRSLKEIDILYISVNVVLTGSYTISAITDNGYSFSKSGIFETPGTYTIALEGFGTPMNQSAGDLVTFTLNGKKNTKCNQYTIKVKSSAIDFEIVSASSFTWKGYKGIALNGDDNMISLNVNVKTAGYWKIQGDKTDNGITLSGSGQFDQEDVGKTIPISVYAQGTPKEAKISNFTFKTNSVNNPTSTVSVNVEVVEASFELACDKLDMFSYRGEYQEGSVLNRGNSVTIPVKVINPGPIEIELIGSFTGSGSNQTVKFKSSSFLGKTGDIQLITLIPDNASVPLNTKEITFTSITPSMSLCSTFPPVPVNERSKVYSVNCGSVRPTGTYKIEKPLEEGKDGIRVKINVGFADTYDIRTNSVNGVSFSKKGTFSDIDRSAGVVEITLDGIGTPAKADVFTYEITSYAGDGTTVYHSCEGRVSFVGPTINVLAVGTIFYAPTDKGTRYAPNSILQNTRLFGPNGVVKVGGINIFTNRIVYRFPDNLRNYLKDNNIDIVITGYPTRYSQTEFEALRDFLTQDNGAVIMADESNLNISGTDTSNLLVNALQNSSTALQATNRSEAFTMVNHVLDKAKSDVLIRNGFGGTLDVQYTGNDAGGNGWYFKNLNPQYYESLIVSNIDSNWVSCFRHKNYGFVFIGDGGAFAGQEGGHPSRSIWPVAYTNAGGLFGKDYLDRGTVYSVQNSVLYANMLKWAIEYVMANKNR